MKFLKSTLKKIYFKQKKAREEQKKKDIDQNGRHQQYHLQKNANGQNHPIKRQRLTEHTFSFLFP